jgi:LDH2 family malate/lactate/ureidoglycolate dehydrogenase
VAVVKVEKLRALYVRIAAALGAPAEEAKIFSDCLVRADLRGMYTQGAAIVPYMVWMVENRLMNFGAPFTILREEAGMALVDGGRGVGSVVSTRAMELAIAKAKSAGLCGVWVRNGGDFALTSNHALQALAHDQVGIAMRNCSPRVAPWGGREAFFGTNPLSVAIPGGEEPPIVIDMASGSFSVGQVVMAARDRRKMPTRHLVDPKGAYTDDPLAIIVDPADRESAFSGAIVTQGHRGMAWSLIVELFAGLLSGMGTSNLNAHEQSARQPWNEGIFLMAVDVAKLRPVDGFKAAADALVRALRAVKPAQGFERVIVPGEQEAVKERKYLKEGVPVREEDWAGVLRTAARLGIGED